MNRQYIEAIRTAARKVLPAQPLSGTIEVEIVFVARGTQRPDVDNIPKPILDALKWIAYHDDSQVVSARPTVLEAKDELRIVGGKAHNTFSRLIDEDVFLIQIRPVIDPSLVWEMESS